MESRDSNTTMMALAALMFFAPLVQYMLKRWTLNLSTEDQMFVWWYIRLWHINWIFLLITIISWIANFFVSSSILSVLYAICIGIVLILLIVWSLCVLSHVSLSIQKDFTLQFYEVGDKRWLLLKFFPFYNIYARYQVHNFGNPNRRLKESLIWRTFFVLFAVTGHPLVLSVIIVLRLLRIVTLMAGIDVLHIKVKSDINTLFFKNPEEIWWYVTGSLVFIIKSIAAHIAKPKNIFTLHTCIQAEKDAYSRLYNMHRHREIWIEYAIWWGILFLYRYFVGPDLTQRSSYLPLSIILWRYLIMLITRWYLPSLPLAREIWLLINYPVRLLVHKHGDAQD